MDTLKILGQRVKALRQERNLSQREMSEWMEKTLRHYQRVENGEVNIPALTLCKLADYFGVTTEYLLGRCDRR